jgi:hypothetical protein
MATGNEPLRHDLPDQFPRQVPDEQAGTGRGRFQVLDPRELWLTFRRQRASFADRGWFRTESHGTKGIERACQDEPREREITGRGRIDERLFSIFFGLTDFSVCGCSGVSRK